MAANQNVTQLTQQTGTANTSSLFYAVTGGNTDTGLPLSVLFASPTFTGIPLVPTAATATNTTQIASTAYVQSNLIPYLLSATAASTYAPIASPTFTGVPAAPTAAPGTNTTQLATTSFVVTTYAPLNSPTLTGVPVAPTPATADNSTTIATTAYVKNQLVSPAFTGIPTAPTAATNTNTTQLATTAFVEGEFANPPSAGFGSGTARPVAATTITATGTITPSQTNGIVGTNAVNNAIAGSIGEVLTNSTTGTAITSGVTVNATSLSLTAGDWDVWGQALFLPVATTIVADIASGIGTTSAVLPTSPNTSYLGVTLATGTNGTTTLNPMMVRINVSTTTTVFLTAEATSVTVSTATVNGYIFARRRR